MTARLLKLSVVLALDPTLVVHSSVRCATRGPATFSIPVEQPLIDHQAAVRSCARKLPLMADSCRLVDSNLLIFSLAKECPDGTGKRNGYAHSSGTRHRYGLEIKTSAGLPSPTGRQDGTLMTSCTGTNTPPVTESCVSLERSCVDHSPPP
jgi:hypothetical protein